MNYFLDQNFREIPLSKVFYKLSQLQIFFIEKIRKCEYTYIDNPSSGFSDEFAHLPPLSGDAHTHTQILSAGSFAKSCVFPWRISDCLLKVIRQHQTSRSSSGIVYPARLLSLPLALFPEVRRAPLVTIMLIQPRLPRRPPTGLKLYFPTLHPLATICRAHKKS